MITLQRIGKRISQLRRFSSFRERSPNRRPKIISGGGGGDEWNKAWEMAWLPDDKAETRRSPWEADVNFGLGDDADADDGGGEAEAKEYLADMDEKWSERRGRRGDNSGEKTPSDETESSGEKVTESESLSGLDAMKRDYRLKKQRIHAALWMKEIDKLQESNLGSACNDIERLIDGCSDGGFVDEKILGSESEIKTTPDGWETTSKPENDSNVWDMTQREEDILLQEFDRRTAFCKFQIGNFIKMHIFSRRRPIDGWKYMIEEIGPNAIARKGKGGVSRVPTLSDTATQPFKEEKTPVARNSLEPFRKRG